MSTTRFDDTTLQFGDVNVGQLRQQLGRASRQPPRLEIDKVLLFNPEGPRRLASHVATVWACNYLCADCDGAVDRGIARRGYESWTGNT